MLDVYFTPQIKVKEKAPPVLPTPTRLPGEPGGQYSPRQAILYHLTRAKAIARAFLCPKIGGTYEKTSRWALPAQDHAAGRHAKARLRHKPGGGKPQSKEIERAFETGIDLSDRPVPVTARKSDYFLTT